MFSQKTVLKCACENRIYLEELNIYATGEIGYEYRDESPSV